MKSAKRLFGIVPVLLCATLAFQWTSATRVTLVNNVYQNVLVAISPSIGIQDQNTIISQLQKLFNSTSYALYNATGNRAVFKDVTVLFPPSWTTTVRKIVKRDSQWDGPYPSFETADIRVDVENAAYGDNPYTQQSRGCGEPGDFIHVTLSFIADQSNLEYNGKLLALEWVKYRYGVFEEMGRKGDPIYPQMYYDTNGVPKYSTCSNDNVVWENSDPCSSKSSIEGLDDYCDLKADTQASANKYINTSMMSPPVLPVAYRFCNETTHNADAPNRHNVLCKGQSIMDVILQHSDFLNNNNNPGLDNAVPLANVVRSPVAQANIEVIIVYDPMSGDYVNSLRPQLAKFLYYDYPNNSYIGMVTAEKPNVIHFPSTKVNATNRNDIVSNITDITSYNYNTGDVPTAVNTALNAFTQDSNAFARAIILFTYYANKEDLISACQKANASTVQLHFITYNPSLANAFLSISGCPGRLYLIQGQTLTTANGDFNNCYKELQQRAALDNTLMNLPNTILPDAFDQPVVFLQQMAVMSNSTLNNTFTLDVSPSSMNTYFYGETCGDKIYDCDPSNLIKFLLNGQDLLNLNSSTKACFSNGPLPKTGVFSYTVQEWQCPAGRAVPYLVTAAGQPVIDTTSSTFPSDNIEIKAWTVTTTSKGNPLVRVFASVKKGTTPIFNAKVMANVTASSDNSPISIITLYDDGSGNPDVTAQDGVYSAYFTQFQKTSSPTSYTIVVNVTDNGAASYPITTYPWISGTSSMSPSATGKFRRTIQAGSFSASTSGASSDVYPPGPIRDFRVESVKEQKVTVTWTAPGDDYDYGQAASYSFACVNDRNKFNGISCLSEVTSDSNVPSTTPDVAKTTQTASFSGNYDSTIYYCAIQAVDEANNCGEISNIVTYFIVSEGLSSAAIAGIVVGVILLIIALILLGVLLWYCLRDKPKEEDRGATGKLNPIVIPEQAKTLGARRNSFESVQYLAQGSVIAPSHTSKHDDERSSLEGRYSQTGMATFPKSSTPSLVAVNVPIVPTSPQHIEFQERPESDNFDVFQHADVAIPEKIPIKIAEIENVTEYQDARLQNRPGQENVDEYRDIPLYNHILNKSASSLHSYSGSSSSINTAGRQHISQV